MRSLFAVVVVLALAACGSVSAKDDAGVDAIPPGGANIALEKMTSWVAQGGSTNIGFTITRGSTQTGALKVHVANLPSGVTAPDVDVAAGATTGTIAFAATTASTVGSTTSVDVTLSTDTMQLDHRPFDVFVAGAPGTLDTTYGTAGVATLRLPDPNKPGEFGNGFVRAFAQYPASAGANAGKLVLAVELVTTGTATTAKKIAVVRLNLDGSADTTFNSNGYVLLSAANSNVWLPAGLAIDSQGRIVVGARDWINGGSCNMYIGRLTAAGAVDSTFTAFDSTPVGYCGYARDLTVIAGDKVVALGEYNQADGSFRPVLVQLKSDGSVDSTAFGSSYVKNLPNPDTTKPSMRTNRIFVDSSGNYILTGTKCNGGYDFTNNPPNTCESMIGRVTAAGAWDTTFGTGGAGHLGYSGLVFGATTTPQDMQGFQGMAFDSMGKMVTVGWDERYGHGTIARWNTDGSIDTSFGTSGRVTPVLSSGGTVQELTEVGIDSSGRVVPMGYAANGGGLAVATRYSTTGTIDTGFANAGVATQPAAGLQTVGTLQLDGRILVVGAIQRTGAVGVADLAVWRFWP